jgi:hypothetical protein
MNKKPVQKDGHYQPDARAKRGNPRKSRLPRLPVSFGAGSFEFEPTEDDWRRIETAYPFLSPADRDEISRIATNYLLHAPCESSAPKMAYAMAWLDDGKKAAEAFLNAWHKWPSADEKAFAANYAQCLVEHHIGHRFLPEGNEWYALFGIMTHVVAAFGFAKRELEEGARAGFVEGQEWDELVCQLTDFAEQRGYPVGASKGVDKSTSDMNSPFVGLVRELQNTFPEVCRRHTASDMAIAEAIAVARRKRRNRRKAKLATTVD